MKKSMIIGKRQMVLAVLVLALGAAVYLNWRFADAGGGLDLTGQLSSKTTSSSAIGDAKYVNQNSSKTEKTSFSAARQDREKARKDAAAMLQEVLGDVKANKEAVATATEKVTQLAKNMESESAIETLIKAKGFTDCVAIINDNKINILVPVEDKLLDSQTLQIQDIVTGQIDVSLENIKIVPVK